MMQEKKADTDEHPGLKPITVKELSKIKAPKDWVIEKLQRPGEIEMDFSEAGSYKSLLALHRAVCVSNGLPFLGLETKKRPVLYLDNENSIPLLGTRLNRILKGLEIKNKNFPLTFLIRNGQLDFGDFADLVKDFIKQNNIGLTIVDTARRFHSMEENSSQEMNDLYKILIGLITETKSALLVLHHTNKQGDYRGSGDLKGMLDSQVKIEKHGKEGNFSFVNEKNRWGDIEEIHGKIFFEDNENKDGTITFELTEKQAHGEMDKYNKFKRLRGFVILEVERLCPMDGTEFKRQDIADLIVGHNADNSENKNAQFSTRQLDQVLKHLTKYHYFEKGEKQGIYSRNFAEKDKTEAYKGHFLQKIKENEQKEGEKE